MNSKKIRPTLPNFDINFRRRKRIIDRGNAIIALDRVVVSPLGKREGKVDSTSTLLAKWELIN